MRTTSKATFTALVAVTSLIASIASGITPEDKCELKKNKIAGKYALCRQNAEAKAIAKNEAPDYSQCDERLVKTWEKEEQKAINKGTSCIDAVTSAEIQSFVTAHSDAVAAALDGGTLGDVPTCMLPASGQTTVFGPGSDGDVQAGAALSYTDNGDGTITDNNSGLMWEKKDDSGGIHDKDNTYTWCGQPLGSCPLSYEMNGTVKTVFLDTLNDVAGGGTSCFAGYCDWRLPNVKELQSIVDYEVAVPSVDPVFNQPTTCPGCTDLTLATCSCTALLTSGFTLTSTYWSATSLQGILFERAWAVDFISGSVIGGPRKGGYDSAGIPADPHHARAVRGGL